MLLSCQNVSIGFAQKEVLRDVSFMIDENEKVALVGENGAGKSTLLKILAGEQAPDSGNVIIDKYVSVGYLPQDRAYSSDNTIYEEARSVKKHIFDLEAKIHETSKKISVASGVELEQLLSVYHRQTEEFEKQNGFAAESEVVGTLKGLGFSQKDFNRKVSTLSGGQKTRLLLGKLLLERPDFLMLDEPTNHLDMASVTWLENFLVSYPKAILLVSHDRYFLDRVVRKVLCFEGNTIRMYSGNYSAFAEKQSKLRKAALHAYEKQQDIIKHQEEVIRTLKSYNREKSVKRARSREKVLEKMKIEERPDYNSQTMRLRLQTKVESGNDVLSVVELSKSFGSLNLFDKINFEIKKGEHVALIGENGTGKSTLLKILNNLTSADGGYFRFGVNTIPGYYDQEHSILHAEKSIFEEISDDFPTLTNTEIRNMLAAFMFTEDKVFQKVDTLSGGEQGRVLLAKLMLSKANFLLLDEPTNHLDIPSKEALEEALNNYEGTVLYVSHDRYFINRTAARILELDGTSLFATIGNYDDYLEEKSKVKIQSESVLSLDDDKRINSFDLENFDVTTSSKEERRMRKEELAQERKLQNDLQKTENKIYELEQKLQELDELLQSEKIYTDYEKCHIITIEKDSVTTMLEDLYVVWDELSSRAKQGS
ncbi:MAG: ABC-F type ribosomal protection protein [Lachnospiraceae bacterium]|jgi:ATP-binding cassette subfamily F protein 3|nr:ABC-F type ribosomal protection protein [Lachnospiraceae bacterium]